MCFLSQPYVSWFEAMQTEIATTPELKALKEQILLGEMDTKYTTQNDLILYKQHVLLLPNSPLTKIVVVEIHNGTHEGVQKTLHRIRKDFYWKGMTTIVQKFISACTVCQCNKTKHLHPASLLQLLDIPYQIRSNILMDFIDGLP